MQRLERQGLLDRELEFLPTTEEVAERIERRRGADRAGAVGAHGLHQDRAGRRAHRHRPARRPVPARATCTSTSPARCGRSTASRSRHHPLRREIVMTQVVNALVNGAGITFYHRLSEETGASAEELDAGELRGPGDLRLAAPSSTASTPTTTRSTAQTQIRMRIEMRTLVERASRWLVNNRRPPMDSRATSSFFRDRRRPRCSYADARAAAGLEQRGLRAAARGPLLRAGRARATWPSGSRCCPPAYAVLTIVETATRDERRPVEVARLHFALGERLELSSLVARDPGLPRDDRWQTMARAALRDDLHAVHGTLTAQVLARTSDETVGRGAHRATGRSATRWWSTGPWRRCRRSAATTGPTWRGCPSACGWCGRCWPRASSMGPNLGHLGSGWTGRACVRGPVPPSRPRGEEQGESAAESRPRRRRRACAGGAASTARGPPTRQLDAALTGPTGTHRRTPPTTSGSSPALSSLHARTDEPLRAWSARSDWARALPRPVPSCRGAGRALRLRPGGAGRACDRTAAPQSTALRRRQALGFLYVVAGSTAGARWSCADCPTTWPRTPAPASATPPPRPGPGCGATAATC